ncbi:hypothetical protein [Aeromonas salmonicida]|uniref:hypothetical protein n=1 Tax=Aeromonas salmonicida TaxID=645 RepID=UPI00232EE821|nr:hypothetical protein [Aeromonas salmonicida]WCH25147.1 hypothetical protein ONZ54_23055 [Aeromonas salmonicida]
MQDLQAPTHEDVKDQPLPVDAEQQPEVDQSAALRQAVANNYLNHCINGAAADNPPEAPPVAALLMGTNNAIISLLLAVLHHTPEQNDAQLNVIATSLGEVSVGGRPLPEVLMEVWAVAQGRQGTLNQLIGKLRDRVELDRNQFVADQLQQLHTLITPPAAEPAKRKPKPAAKR